MLSASLYQYHSLQVDLQDCQLNLNFGNHTRAWEGGLYSPLEWVAWVCSWKFLNRG